MKIHGRNTRLFMILGILITIFLFSLIETLNPYNFLEDDNAVQFLPNILVGMEQLFSGHLPSINLHQLMGTKILETGTYAVLYPPMIISYFFSHYFLENDFLTMEIFILFHLILGFLFSFKFLNSKTKASLPSLLGSLAFVFSGYGISLSSAWYYVAPVFLFLPLILYLNDKIDQRNVDENKKIVILLGIVRGIFFYAGNAQYFMFMLFFEFAYFIIKEYQSGGDNFSDNLKKYSFSLLLSFIILFPLLFSQLQVSMMSPRGNIPLLKYILSRGALPTDILIGTVIFPFLLKSTLFFRYSAVHYSGTLFSLLFFVGGIYLLKRYKKKSFKKISPLFWCGIISIILSLGILGFFYSFGALIPFIKNFEGPFKFIIFTNFFMISFGTIIFSKILKNKNFSKFYIFTIVLIFTILLMSSIIFISHKDKYSYFERLPADKNYFDKLYLFEDYRFISVATGSDFSPKNSSNSLKISSYPEAYFLSKNFATYFDLDHISGYEPFMDELTYEFIPVFREGISNKHLNTTTLQEYGVKYIVIFKEGLTFHSELSPLNRIYEEEDLLILEIPNAKGYIFWDRGNLNYTRTNNGFYFNTSFNDKQNVTINLLYKKGYVCKINGKKVDIKQDIFGRMFVEIPKGDNEIQLFYLPKDFLVGILISLFLLLFFILLQKMKLNVNLLNLRKNKFIKFVYDNLWKIFWFFLLLCILLIFLTLLSKSNIENSIENKFGINVEIGKIKFGIKEISIQDFSILNEEKVTFYSSRISFRPNITNTFNNFLSSKKPIIFFDEVRLSNVSGNFKFSNVSDSSCDLRLNINYPKSFNKVNNFTLSKEELYLNNSYLYLPNRFSFSLNKELFELSSYTLDENIYLDSNLSIGRYISGNISLYDKSGIQSTKEDCLILPVEIKNNVFY